MPSRQFQKSEPIDRKVLLMNHFNINANKIDEAFREKIRNFEQICANSDSGVALTTYQNQRRQYHYVLEQCLLSVRNANNNQVLKEAVGISLNVLSSSLTCLTKLLEAQEPPCVSLQIN